MSGLLIRLRLFLKLWFTSIYSILVMLLIPVAAYVIHSSRSYTLEELASIIYEKAAPIWFVLILQWCFSIDFRFEILWPIDHISYIKVENYF